MVPVGEDTSLTAARAGGQTDTAHCSQEAERTGSELDSKTPRGWQRDGCTVNKKIVGADNYFSLYCNGPNMVSSGRLVLNSWF